MSCFLLFLLTALDLVCLRICRVASYKILAGPFQYKVNWAEVQCVPMQLSCCELQLCIHTNVCINYMTAKQSIHYTAVMAGSQTVIMLMNFVLNARQYLASLPKLHNSSQAGELTMTGFCKKNYCCQHLRLMANFVHIAT